MFNFLKKSKKKSKNPYMVDLEGRPLQEGDEVESLRYDLGKCVLIKEEETFYYESLETGEKISWIKMIDAATEFQKVRKLD